MKTVRNKIIACLVICFLALPVFSQDAITKAIDSIGQNILIREYEKAYSYASFIMRFYRTNPMTPEALDACERAVAAYSQDLASKQKWKELVALSDALASAPLTISAKAAEPVAKAKTELARIEAERIKQADEARKAEAEQARLAQIENALKIERDAEKAREAARIQEREAAQARETALLAERAKAEEAQRAQYDKLIEDNRKAEAAKELQSEQMRQEFELKQQELEVKRSEAENKFREELSRVLETSNQTNGETIRSVTSTSIAVVAGLGILALFVIAGISLLVVVSLRQQKMQHEQFQSTLHTIQAMRNVQPNYDTLALPFASQDNMGQRALPGNQNLMIEGTVESNPNANQGTNIVQSQANAEAQSLKSLIEKCQTYGQEIDKATGRRNASRLVGDLVYKVSRHLGYSEQDSLLFFAVGLVYDIGFLNVEPTILRAERINEEQFELIKTHTKVGLAMVFFVEERYRDLFKDGVSKHHENLDGTGYPFALKGEAIPYIARALRVAESYIALISSREYRQIRDRDAAITELKAHPNQYDQDIVAAIDAIV